MDFFGTLIGQCLSRYSSKLLEKLKVLIAEVPWVIVGGMAVNFKDLAAPGINESI